MRGCLLWEDWTSMSSGEQWVGLARQHWCLEKKKSEEEMVMVVAVVEGQEGKAQCL